MSKFRNIQKLAYEANMKLPELDLVVFTFGNASVLDQDQGVFAIKPSGVEYDKLSVEGMVVCDFEGAVVEGDLRPSSDTRTHAVLYKNWGHLGGIVHILQHDNQPDQRSNHAVGRGIATDGIKNPFSSVMAFGNRVQLAV